MCSEVRPVGIGGGGPLQQRHRRRVVEGAQHAGDVAQRRVAAAAVLDGPARLALEVEHRPAGVGAQHLAEVVVAVDADCQPRVMQGADGGDARLDRRAVFGDSLHRLGVAGDECVEVGEHLVRPLRRAARG